MSRPLHSADVPDRFADRKDCAPEALEAIDGT
jgi:hypothetical protein